jgi:hypothetical protein
VHSNHGHGEGPARQPTPEEIAQRQKRIARREVRDERREARVERHRPDRPLGFWGRVGEWVFFPALFLAALIMLPVALATGARLSWQLILAMLGCLAGLAWWIRAVPLRYRRERAQAEDDSLKATAREMEPPPPWRSRKREKRDLEL